MQPEETPSDGHADVGVVAASPVDTTRAAGPARSWLETGRSSGEDNRWK
ncbi:hypothetical protein [Streptomyces canus]